ncbi:MAG: hypothetical protein JW874_11095, partial [Spirochaetales bacterium]|nr:hypothetical protein [Spirochaetales bacterium]
LILIPLTRDVLISFPFITIIAFVKMRIAGFIGPDYKFLSGYDIVEKCIRRLSVAEETIHADP